MKFERVEEQDRPDDDTPSSPRHDDRTTPAPAGALRCLPLILLAAAAFYLLLGLAVYLLVR